MKRVIRNKNTRQYLQENGSWGKPDSALDFDSLSDVVNFVQQRSLTDVELVLMMGDAPSVYDVILHLDPVSHSKQNSVPPHSATGL